jgi:hypothetical protein
MTLMLWVRNAVRRRSDISAYVELRTRGQHAVTSQGKQASNVSRLHQEESDPRYFFISTSSKLIVAPINAIYRSSMLVVTPSQCCILQVHAETKVSWTPNADRTVYGIVPYSKVLSIRSNACPSYKYVAHAVFASTNPVGGYRRQQIWPGVRNKRMNNQIALVESNGAQTRSTGYF